MLAKHPVRDFAVGSLASDLKLGTRECRVRITSQLENTLVELVGCWKILMKQRVGAIVVAERVYKKVSERLQVDCHLDVSPFFYKVLNSLGFWLRKRIWSTVMVTAGIIH